MKEEVKNAHNIGDEKIDVNEEECTIKTSYVEFNEETCEWQTQDTSVPSPQEECKCGEKKESVCDDAGHRGAFVAAGTCELSQEEKATCSCSEKPEDEQPCPPGTLGEGQTREITCNTETGEWEAGEWNQDKCCEVPEKPEDEEKTEDGCSYTITYEFNTENCKWEPKEGEKTCSPKTCEDYLTEETNKGGGTDAAREQAWLALTKKYCAEQYMEWDMYVEGEVTSPSQCCAPCASHLFFNTTIGYCDEWKISPETLVAYQVSSVPWEGKPLVADIIVGKLNNDPGAGYNGPGSPFSKSLSCKLEFTNVQNVNTKKFQGNRLDCLKECGTVSDGTCNNTYFHSGIWDTLSIGGTLVHTGSFTDDSYTADLEVGGTGLAPGDCVKTCTDPTPSCTEHEPIKCDTWPANGYEKRFFLEHCVEQRTCWYEPAALCGGNSHPFTVKEAYYLSPIVKRTDLQRCVSVMLTERL